MQISRSRWPRGLRRRSAATRLLGLWVRIPPGAWMSVSCECCVLSGRGLCNGLITHPEESYRLWCVVVCDLETSRMRRPWPTGGCCAKRRRIMQLNDKRRLRCLWVGEDQIWLDYDYHTAPAWSAADKIWLQMESTVWNFVVFGKHFYSYWDRTLLHCVRWLLNKTTYHENKWITLPGFIS